MTILSAHFSLCFLHDQSPYLLTILLFTSYFCLYTTILSHSRGMLISASLWFCFRSHLLVCNCINYPRYLLKLLLLRMKSLNIVSRVLVTIISLFSVLSPLYSSWWGKSFSHAHTHIFPSLFNPLSLLLFFVLKINSLISEKKKEAFLTIICKRNAIVFSL